MIVVDASVVVDALGGSGERSLRALRRVAQVASLAPHLLDIEVAAALRGVLLRKAILEPLARRALRNLAHLPITRIPHEPLLERCWELRVNLTVYDASYVALAEATGATLLTVDRRAANAPGINCEVELLS